MFVTSQSGRRSTRSAYLVYSAGTTSSCVYGAVSRRTIHTLLSTLSTRTRQYARALAAQQLAENLAARTRQSRRTSER